MRVNLSEYHNTVIDIFQMNTQRIPNAIAISDDQSSLTYKRLDEKTNQIAHWLQQQCVKPGDFVAILLAPSIDFIVSMLAIVKVGAVYIPLDGLAPQKRLAQILEDAAPKLMLTDGTFNLPADVCPTFLISSVESAVSGYSTERVKAKLLPTSPLYMMYTSGSTGSPKGVIASHRAVVNLVAVDNYAKVHEGKRIAQFSNLAFDGSTFEIWSALLNGSTLVIVPQEIRTDPFTLREFLERHSIEYLFLPTSLFHQLIKSAINVLNHVKVIVFGGEQVNIKLLKTYIKHRQKSKLSVTLINGYGPTEATTFTCRRIYDENSSLNADDDELASIGQAIDNVKTYILDENQQMSLEGELYISGVNLALGYHNCPHQNEEKFIRNPFCKDESLQRLYKTGDKVKRLPSGNLLYLGRLDDQVKIGGFRIHLNEVENQLMKHPDISLAAVTVELGGGAHQMLTAYLVLASKDKKIDDSVIRNFLNESLPPYMIPSKYCLVDQLPLTLVGKIDRSQLNTLPHIDLSLHSDPSSLNQIEEQIKRIWMHLLNHKAVDVNKNLFEMGVNSLLMTEACTRINEALQSKLQVSALITYPTIHRLSRYLEGDIEDEGMNLRRKQAASGDIAIIGMSCRFPKANSIQAFWDNLCQGESCLTRFTDVELAQAGCNIKSKHENFVPVKGILSDIEQFDANFFGFNPVDASLTDPQQRVFLECAWEALEHAGVAPSKTVSRKISVFAGMADSTYLHENLLKNQWVYQENNRFQQRLASSIGMLSTQVSYRLNLKGRSLNINTACSTGLVTVAAACQDLVSGSSDVALAGAVSIVVPQVEGYIYQPGSIESPDGICRPFDSRANGTVFSNGAGIVVLKRLEDAINDKDTIYAVIKGIGVNNDGADKLGYTAPSTHGQKNCIREALNHAGIQATEMGYVEAHGTATALGDVVEMEALSAVYREQSEKEQFCALGSVKGNIGHTDVTAGLAGLIKASLCLYYQKIPPTLHFEHPHPDICLETSPFFINPHLMDWKSVEKRRYAGVSSFGVGGTNAHLILSEHLKQDNDTCKRQEHLFILSAKSEAALVKNRDQLVDFIAGHSDGSHLANAAYTLQTGREDFEWRCFAVASTEDEIKKNLLSNHIKHCETPISQDVMFMFPGQGTQYHHMAAQLMEEFPYFASLVHQGVNLAETYLHVNLLEILRDEADEKLNQTQYAQPLLFIIEYALAQLLMYEGIKPNGLIGHSLGEYVAACVAGVFSYEDGVALVCQRGLLMAGTPRGAMLSIVCSIEELADVCSIEELADYQQDTELALHNAINHCVASGEAPAISSLEKRLSAAGKTYQKLKVSHAFHSRLMESIEQSFKALFDSIQLSAPKITIVSNVTGKWISTQEATDPAYWYRHLRHTVQFCKGLETILADHQPILIEVGPGQSLSVFLKEVAAKQKKQIKVIQTLPTHHRQKTDLNQFLNALGSLWQTGISINWSATYGGECRAHIPLPTYAFQRQRYWIEPDNEQRTYGDGQPKLYKPVWSHQPAYLTSIELSKSLLAQHEWIIIKDKLGMSDSLIARLEREGIHPIIISFNKTHHQRDDFYFEINPEEKAHYVEVLQTLQHRLTQPIVLHCGSYAKMDNEFISSKAIEKHLTTGFYSLLYFTQAYLEVIGEQCPLKVGVITAGTQQVLGTEAIYPVHATVVGPCRVIPQEHGLLKFRLMDLNPVEAPEQNEKLINKILETCLNETWDEPSLIKAYRNGHEWSLMYGRINVSPKVTNRLRDKGVYLLTGGTGGIALSCCEAIARTVSSPIFILLSRSKFPDESEWDEVLQDPTHHFYEKISRVRTLQALGATCYFYAVDIGQFQALKGVIDQCCTRFGKINGVIHCAGVPGGGVVQMKSKEKAHGVFFPKIHGTYNLVRALRKFSPDFVVLMSSIAALTGERGQVEYCGANACLDTFSSSPLFSPTFVCSINWNTWIEVGMAVDAANSEKISFIGRGNDLSTAQGQALFLEILKKNDPNVAISNFDMSLNDSQFFQKKPIASMPNVEIARKDLNVATVYLAPRNRVESKLAKLWQETLGVKEIGCLDDFFALGGHSLKALDLIEKINKTFDCKLTINHLFHAPTIKELSANIVHGIEKQPFDMLIPLRLRKKSPPYLFLCHPVSGMIYCFDSFITQYAFSVSIYGLQDPSIGADKILYESLPAMAKAYLEAIKKIQPQGPYLLLGYSFGGNVLYEVAQMLLQQGNKLELLAMIDSWAITSRTQQNELHFKNMFLRFHQGLPLQIVDLSWERMKLLLNHTPSKMNQKMILFKASQLLDDYKEIDHTVNGWSNYNNGEIICYQLDADHETIMNVENSQKLLNILIRQGKFN